MSELSPARLAANLANAQRSTGPRTPEGKATSALNSLVHGLRAATVVLPCEDVEVFEALRADLADEHQPQTVTEQHLVDKMAAAHWAIDRARRQEIAALTLRVLEAVAECDPEDVAACQLAAEAAQFDGSKEGSLRLRYIVAHENTYNRALRTLMALRRQRQREEKASEALQRRQEREEQAAQRLREREEKAAAKRSAPIEPKPTANTSSPPLRRGESRPGGVVVHPSMPAHSHSRTAPAAPSCC